MKISLIYLFILLILTSKAMSQSSTDNFDNDWLFYRGAFLGGEEKQTNDSVWRKVDLPHDWSIEDIPGTSSPFDSLAISQVSGGFTSQGTAWYRKWFSVPEVNKDKKIVIQFDGVYMNADVFINGTHLGNHPYGYTSFYFDITRYVEFGKKNVIAVEVKNEGQNSRWYSGSGIYRHVWLKTLEPVHFVQWGAAVNTDINSSHAHVSISSQVINERKNAVRLRIVTAFTNPSGELDGQTQSELILSPNEQKVITQGKDITTPQLWSCETPALYHAITKIYEDAKLIDSSSTPFGIRKLAFDAVSGFRLNDKPLKLKGGCFHNDNGPLGSRAYDRAEERKVELMKASGFNAIRCSHNPPSPAFLDACDRLGMLVIDEYSDMWNLGKNPYDYHLYFKDWWKKDIESMILRDRNHPSVIMWSIGNEIPEKGDSLGFATARTLSSFVKSLDSTRPVTAAVNELNPGKDPFFAALDIAGYNYASGGDHNQPDIYQQDHERLAQRVMYGTESYPLEAFGSWKAVEDHPYVIGDFVWTAWDYIGESSIGWLGYPQNKKFYPWNLAFCGDIDICGWKRPQSFYRDALWKHNQLSLFVTPPEPSFPLNPDIASWSKWNWLDVVPEWNWKGYENKPLQVHVYSSCERAELFLNNKSLGVKQTGKENKYIATWNVPYGPGELKAVGYSGKKVVNTSTLRTPGKATAIRLTTDKKTVKADNQDLSYVTIEIVDDKGNIDPSAENLIKFTLSGNGEIAGTGNADPRSVESFQKHERKLWKGRCLVIIKAGKTKGTLVLKAEADGAGAAQTTINVTM